MGVPEFDWGRGVNEEHGAGSPAPPPPQAVTSLILPWGEGLGRVLRYLK